MKRPAAFLLSLLIAAATALFGAPAGAQENPSPEPARLRLDLGQLNPRVITSSDQALTVTGTVTNTGSRRIVKPMARLQIGERLASPRAMDSVLAGNPVQDSPLTEFTSLAEELEPGQSARLAITVPLAGARGAALRPGVYPLLVNVNGTPEYGGPARLAAVSLLMPVLSTPGHTSNQATQRHAKLAVLWPVTDSTPHIQSAPFGVPMTLTDDSLADELSPGGRLYSLVSAARAAQETNPKVGGSLCFALDPDLLRTVDAMRNGYRVSGGAAGKGADAATNWLAALRALVTGRCVIPLPFADADLTTLGKIRGAEGNPDASLMTTALNGTATIRQVLGVESKSGVLWPGGTPDEKALSAISSGGFQTVLTDSGKLRAGGDDETVTGAATLSDGLRAQPTNSMATAGLTGFTPSPQTPTTYSGASQRAVSTQNGLAAVAFEAGLGRTEGATGGPLLVAPPRRWDATTDELNAFLSGLGKLTNAGVTAGSTLDDLLGSTPEGSASLAADTRSDGGAAVASQLSGLDQDATGLVSAMQIDPRNQVEPKAIVGPVRDALVRGSSTAFGPPAVASASANATAELAAIRDQVTVEQPKQTIALASGSSPLPVYVHNDLPVGVTAQIALRNNMGVRPEQADKNLLFPAKGGQTKYVQIEALRAGRLSVDVSLTTPSGTDLGATARFELTSTEYGPITIIVTVVAGCALLLLASRRIYRRIKESRGGTP
ncbi:glycoprotein [Amycolatopsis rubida]|uniref:Glycoprotein n=1 Tax=Amycolatopsis rubida TaxID=112413 RepID=A0A1I5F603_9PSEU|nr:MULTISPECIES: DUF6049 family protein [Amycolatopsis]MYW92236.1 glycoprotein [Amycolatopsis rubida]NEC57223.1 glycoprotein [Amycolatopsis rubida]OAP27091.1 hypothetical protein A4R44_01896 [Amycolatopsis sp. M39]SFO19046.1 hypothetical protein SAMN05421854_101956 [Amycolatopsis rubida]